MIFFKYLLQFINFFNSSINIELFQSNNNN